MDYSGKIIRKTPVTPSQTSASGVWQLDEALQAQKNNNWPVANVPNPISRSLRFRSSASAFLNRTPATTSNRQIWTYSGWIKRGQLGSNQNLLRASTGGADDTLIRFTSGDVIQIYSNAATNLQLDTTAVYRDPSSWYHIVVAVDTTQATSSNRAKLYVNGVQVTAFSTTSYPTQNANTNFNSTSFPMRIGTYVGAQEFFDGYMTEVNFIDGQALTPSSFGGTNAVTGVWEPRQYTGTYGTNGFYLNFKDNTSTATLGTDYSGNSNTWTTNNISLTAGSTYDSMLDVPTQWIGYNTGDVASVTRGNYATLNSVAPGDYFASGQTALTLTNANLNYGTAGRNAFGTIAVSSGKYYWEMSNTSNTASAVPLFGLVTVAARTSVYGVYYQPNGNKGLGTLNSGASETAYGATWTDNDIIGVALDMDAATPTVTYYKNNTSQGAISVSSFVGQSVMVWIQNGANSGNMAGWINHGQRPFSYTPPAGFLSLCTTNLPSPTILQGNQYFDVLLYTGNGGTQTISGLNFQPTLVWGKARSSAISSNLFDQVRGGTRQLVSNTSDAETVRAGNAVVFNSNGITLDATYCNINNTSVTNVAWNWAGNGTGSSNTAGSITSTVSANTSAGFSVVTYTGNGSAGATVGHGIGVAPRMLIIKARDGAGYSWKVYHGSLGSGSHLELESTAAAQGGIWNSTNPSSTVFTLGTNAGVNENGKNYVCYAFSEVAGYSKFDSYTGNGSTDGTFVFTGFRPKFVMLKSSSNISNWIMMDTSTNPNNVMSNYLRANASDAEASTSSIDAVSNGFKLRTTDTSWNSSGGTFIYMAFAENPFKNALAR